MIEAAGIRSVSDYEVRELFGMNGSFHGDSLAGILFPYVNRASRRVGGRVRLDNLTSNGIKYVSELGNRHLFFPPGAWDLVDDPSVPIIIVEAEKSSLSIAALAHRANKKMIAIAVGGCFGWKRNRGKREIAEGGTEPFTGPSPDFDLINWATRRTLLAFDSNTSTNSDVRRGRSLLQRELVDRGANVAFVEIPPLEGVNGPDDLIAVAGDEAMLRAIDMASIPIIMIRAG